MTTEKAVVGMPYARSPFLYSDEGVVESNSMPRRRGVFCKINTVIFVAFAFFSTVSANTVAQNTSSLPNGEREAILDMIAQINHINWVVCTIKSYNNIIVLEEEYEKISPGNLDLSRIPNEETLKRITRMLDTLYSLRRDDRQMKRWREDFKERRRREQKTYLLKASKQAVDTLTEQARECCSLWSWASNPSGSILNVAHTAFNMVHYSVSLYNDYDNFIYELDKSASDKQFDFDSAKLDLLHKQNKEILEDQWSFISRYKLDDRLRVSDVDIKILLKCLKTENHEQLYIRLLPMRERFSLFPEYWYYLSCVAMETGHFKEGIEACDTFFRVNRSIFRDDPMEGNVAFNKAFMLSKTDANKQEVRKCLERAWKNNILRGDWQLDYLVAIMYKGVFNEQAKAEMMLEHAVALIEQESREQTRYSSKASVSLKEGLRNCRNALHELRGEPLEEAETDMGQCVRDETEELVHKLDGCQMAFRLDDELGIKRVNRILFELPNDTFDKESLFKLHVSYNPYFGEKIFREDVSRRFPASGRESDFTTLVFPIDERHDGFSSVQLKLIHAHPKRAFNLILGTADKVLGDEILERGEDAFCRAWKDTNPIRSLIVSGEGEFKRYTSLLFYFVEVEVGTKKYSLNRDVPDFKNMVKRRVKECFKSSYDFDLDF